MTEKKTWLKDNRWPEVLESLQPFVEQAGIPAPEAPVRAGFRYISNRTQFLDYKGALAAGLPIGSGEIESAHGYVFQKRLKISGAWWKDRKSTRLNSSHTVTSYAVFCLKKKMVTRRRGHAAG